LLNIGGEQMVRNCVLQELKPEEGKLVQNLPLIRNASSKDIVESGNAVGCDK
jgi:hypothetical protein